MGDGSAGRSLSGADWGLSRKQAPALQTDRPRLETPQPCCGCYPASSSYRVRFTPRDSMLHSVATPLVPLQPAKATTASRHHRKRARPGGRMSWNGTREPRGGKTLARLGRDNPGDGRPIVATSTQLGKDKPGSDQSEKNVDSKHGSAGSFGWFWERHAHPPYTPFPGSGPSENANATVLVPPCQAQNLSD